MATPSEPSPRAAKSRAKKTRGAKSSEQIISRTVTKEVHRVAGLSEQQRRELVEMAAYYLAERRNFEPGHEFEDWIAAEGLVKEMHGPK
jgi:hypothetical protein